MRGPIAALGLGLIVCASCSLLEQHVASMVDAERGCRAVRVTVAACESGELPADVCAAAKDAAPFCAAHSGE